MQVAPPQNKLELQPHRDDLHVISKNSMQCVYGDDFCQSYVKLKSKESIIISDNNASGATT